MPRVILLTAAIAAATAATAALAASEAPRKTRLEECEQRAKAMKFGLHFIRRDRWIRACLRGEV